MNQINAKPFPTISTERLNLRQLMAEDEEDILKLRADESVSRYISRIPYKTIEEARAFITKINNGINEQGWLYWAITLKGQKNVIGTLCLWNFSKDNFRAEIGYELRPEFQGQGYGQEAVAAAVALCFNQLKLHSIEAVVYPDNAASIKLLERNGFVREGYFKEKDFFDGKFIDTAIYSLLNPS